MKRAIEESFPIVEINRLAIPERNAFKPIYQMHKWFARRASCIFRTILLGALKPAGTDLMVEFYRDHRDDPDTKGKRILDPFMGGGTTVVEAMRLGCEVTGIDLNPVAWFIVKTETEPVEVADLEAAFERLSARIVPWSGKSVRETLLDLYKTAPPWIWSPSDASSEPMPDSDLIYTFWVKSAPCSNPVCKKLVPLFKDYLVAAKSPSVRFHPDCTCPRCHKTFDWEIEPAAMISDPRLMLHGARYSAGVGRSTARWTYAHPDGGLFVAQGRTGGTQSRVEVGELRKGQVCCPHCYESVIPELQETKPKRKKVPLSVLLCPQSEQVFQWRGELPADAEVASPAGHRFRPHEGNIPKNGAYNCPHCGNQDTIIGAIRSLPEDQLLPMHAYAVQAYAPACDRGNAPDEDDELEDLFTQVKASVVDSDEFVPPTQNLVWHGGGKYFAAFQPGDQARYAGVEANWQGHRESLPYPKSKVPAGEKTKSGLIAHNYRYWHQMFNPRQLLALSTLLEGILKEDEGRVQEQLLLCLSATTDTNNLFTRFMASRKSAGGQTAQGVFARHDFQPKVTICEQNVWGLSAGGIGSFLRRYWQSLAGIGFACETSDVEYGDDGGKRVREERYSDDLFREDGGSASVYSQSSASVSQLEDRSIDYVITDPPYSDNVNYSELADFYYSWLRLGLKSKYPQFIPESAPKMDEVIKNKHRGKTDEDFRDDLTNVFREAHRVLKDEGLLAFTFHHAGDTAWQALLEAICNAGFYIEAIYPIQSEGESSLHLMEKDSISYDLIHVCRKLEVEELRPRSWAGLRQEVRRRARAEVESIESGRYGGEPLAPPDVRMILIGKCLEVYSRHYGKVLDWQGSPLPLAAALQDIRLMVEQVVSRENPLPTELDKIDAKSQIWLLAFCDKTEVSYDHVSKLTRGVFETTELTAHKPPLIRKGRVQGGRTYKVLTPLERLDTLRERFSNWTPNRQAELFTREETGAPTNEDGEAVIDVAHFLLAHAELGERLDQWVERFHGLREPLRAIFEFLNQRDPRRWATACGRLLPFYTGSMLAGMAGGGNPEPGSNS